MKARVVTSPRDIPYGEDRIILRWNKIRWRCREDYCERGSFTEAIAQVPARARTTGRLRTAIGAAIGEAARAVAEVADAHGVSWPTAHRAFVAHAEDVLTEPTPTKVLGIDETRRGKPRWQRCVTSRRWVRVDPWDTGFVDLAGDQGLLGQREGRTSATVIDWLRERSEEFRAGIEFVAIDPAAVYAAAIRTPGLLPNATLVVDHFHLVKLANDAVTTVRRRVTWDLRDRRGGKLDPEWANRRRLLRARERLSDKQFATMWNQIHTEDPTAQILSAWIAKEELRTLLSTVHAGADHLLTKSLAAVQTRAEAVGYRFSDDWAPRSLPATDGLPPPVVTAGHPPPPAVVGEHPHPLAVGAEHSVPAVAADPSAYAPHAPAVAADLNAAFTAGHPTTSLAQQVAELSTHHMPSPVGDLVKADRVVLGRWDGMDGGYIGEARHNGGIYFDTGDETWSALSTGLGKDDADALTWRVNESFLRTQLERGVPRFDYQVPQGFANVDEVAREFKKSFSAREINFLNTKPHVTGTSVWAILGSIRKDIDDELHRRRNLLRLYTPCARFHSIPR